MTPEILTLEEVEGLLEDPDICGLKSGSHEFDIGKVLVFAAFVGEEPEQLAIASGLTLSQVKKIAAALVKNGVFGCGNDLAHDYLEHDGSVICLNCDIACGMGELKRGRKAGEVTWVMTDKGLAKVENGLLKTPEAQAFMDELDVQMGRPKGNWRKELLKHNAKKK